MSAVHPPEGFVWAGPPHARFLCRVEGGQRVRRLRPVTRAWASGFAWGAAAGIATTLLAIAASLAG